MSVKWRRFALAEPAAEGYAPTSRPVEELLAAAVARLNKERLPAVVWIHDRLDESTELSVRKVLADEALCLSLERFLCLKADVRTLPDERAREKLAKRAPLLLFYDPSGERVDLLTGRRAGSRSAVCARVERLWARAFTLSQREFTRRMDDVLDRLDRVERERKSLEAKMIRAEDNPAKLEKLLREEKTLEDLEREILADEKAILEACRVRKELAEPDRSGD